MVQSRSQLVEPSKSACPAAAPRPRGRPAGGTSQQTKSSIIEAATKLFSKKDIAEVSMAEIAASAGIQASSIYNHFRSKEALWIETVRQMYIRISSTLEFADRQDLHWRARLRAISDRCLELYREDGAQQWLGIQARQQVARDAARFRDVDEALRNVDAIFIRIASAAIESGDVPRLQNPVVLGELFRGFLFDALAVNLLCDPSVERFNEFVDAFQVLLTGKG